MLWKGEVTLKPGICMSDLLISDLLILLIEPSSTQRRVILSFLKDLGIENVDVAENGTQAMEHMNRVVPDLVISSMHLPEMTGADLLHRMRESGDLSHIPFMLISSETHFRYLEPIRQAGAIAILPKPFQLEQLRSALNSTLDFIDPKLLELNDVSAEDIQVLLVDDSKMARNYIKRVLGDMGLENVVEAENGIEAVNFLREHHFDLIVTDYNMPEMDGKEFIAHVRQESSQPSVPILMVTSESDNSRLAMVEQVGVSAICDKPFEPGNIRELLAKLMN